MQAASTVRLPSAATAQANRLPSGWVMAKAAEPPITIAAPPSRRVQLLAKAAATNPITITGALTPITFSSRLSRIRCVYLIALPLDVDLSPVPIGFPDGQIRSPATG